LNKFLFLLFIAFFHFSSANGQYKKYTYYADKMGSPLKLIIGAKKEHIDSVQSTQLAQETLRFIDSLNHILSDYDSLSELSLINQQAGNGFQPISPLLEEILLIAQNAYYQTKGAYNIAIGPLSLLWRNARQEKVFPSKAQIIEAQKLIAFDQIIIDSIKHQIYIPNKAMRLDLGSLGKGFVAQKAINFLQNKGVQYAMIDAGGKIVTLAPVNEYWQIGINRLREKNKTIATSIRLSNQAVSTSGDAFQFYIYNGHRYSHIINPLSGYGIEIPKNVTVIASNGVTADWLSTACSLLTVSESIQLAAKYNAQILIAIQKGKTIQYFKSKGFDAYLN
jgi:thiamine biosynthesis lipoprotein